MADNLSVFSLLERKNAVAANSKIVHEVKENANKKVQINSIISTILLLILLLAVLLTFQKYIKEKKRRLAQQNF